MGAEITRAVLFGSVPCEDWSFLRDYLEPTFLVICADGGVKNARRAGLPPDLLVGDWDSGGAPEEGIPTLSLPPEKDMTDLQAAADLALSRGCRQLLLCGCTGGRMDHTASNLVLLEWIADRGGRALILDGDNEVRFWPGGSLTVPNRPAYRYLSLCLLYTSVPCSGLGIIRKKPDIRYKDPEPLKNLPAVQSAILDNVARYIRSGGVLLYATCTLLERENEAVVGAFLDRHSNFTLEPFQLPGPIGHVEGGKLTLWPHLHNTDGFFMARLRRGC